MLATCVIHGNEDVDVVVKLNGSMEFGARGAVFELVGSLMAIRSELNARAPSSCNCPRSSSALFAPGSL